VGEKEHFSMNLATSTARNKKILRIYSNSSQNARFSRDIDNIFNKSSSTFALQAYSVRKLKICCLELAYLELWAGL